MKRIIVLVLVTAVLGVPAAALADGPSGSKENGNQVQCAEGTDTGTGKAYAGPNGVEVCSDDNSAPDGRVIVSFEEQYASIDGEADNGDAEGFVRLDSSGPTCGGEKNQDSSSGPGEACG